MTKKNIISFIFEELIFLQKCYSKNYCTFEEKTHFSKQHSILPLVSLFSILSLYVEITVTILVPMLLCSPPNILNIHKQAELSVKAILFISFCYQTYTAYCLEFTRLLGGSLNNNAQG